MFWRKGKDIFLSIDKNDNGYINKFAEMSIEEFLTKGIQLLLDCQMEKIYMKILFQQHFIFYMIMKIILYEFLN